MFEGKLNSDGFPEWTESEFKQAYEGEPAKPEELLYVVAGTMKQASLFARQHGIYPKRWKAVTGPEIIKEAIGTVFYVGTFYERPDLKDIETEVSIGVQQGRLKVSTWDG